MGKTETMDTNSGVIAKEEMNDQDDEQQDFDMETQKALEEMDALQNEMDISSINGEAEQMKVEMEYIKQRKPLRQTKPNHSENAQLLDQLFYESPRNPLSDR